MPDWLAVILLGIIEGVTEFLPVSSTGHLLLVENTGLLPRQTDLFNTVIQCGAVLAVVVVFAGKIQELFMNRKSAVARDYLGKLLFAFVLTGTGGLLLKKLGLVLPKDPRPVAVATLIGGILIFVIERRVRTMPLQNQISWTVAAMIGGAQLLAGAFPGTSRSGATILLALCFGVARPSATEFSFILGIPTLLAAGGLEIFKGMRHGEGPPENWRLLALGTLVSAISAFVVVRWLLRYVQSHTFNPFGWYRVALGLLILVLFR